MLTATATAATGTGTGTGTGLLQMVDVGCGIGGSSRYISRKFGCTANGITLSPKQVC